MGGGSAAEKIKFPVVIWGLAKSNRRKAKEFMGAYFIQRRGTGV